MQILATKSQEGESAGLNWISGKCERFPDDPDLKVPHIGWNAVEAIRNSALSVDMEPESKFYFLHSYYLEPCDPADVVMSARYGDVQFAAMVQRDNIFGVQFHPEKSHDAGRRMIETFVRM
jgi:glutamine amidotransferase